MSNLLAATPPVIVPPHDALHGAQQPLEPILAQRRDLALPLGHHARRPRLIVQQGQFPEVIPFAVELDGLIARVLLEDLGLARLDHEESLTLVPLADDGGAVGELLRLERVGDLAALVEGEGGEQGDLLEEGLVHAAALEGAVHEDAAECDAVEGPQRAVGFRADDRGRARGVVHEGQFAEAPARTDAVHLVAHALRARFDGAGAVDVDVKGALFHDVEVVARVPLGDDLDVFCGDGFLDQGAEHKGGGFVRQVGEEEVGGDGGFEPVELVGRFRVVGRLPVVIRGGRVEGFGGD